MLFLEHKHLLPPALHRRPVPAGRLRAPVRPGRRPPRRATTSRSSRGARPSRSRCRPPTQAARSEGVEVEVVDLRTIAPWDHELVGRVGAPHRPRSLVVHEDMLTCGFGARGRGVGGRAVLRPTSTRRCGGWPPLDTHVRLRADARAGDPARRSTTSSPPSLPRSPDESRRLNGMRSAPAAPTALRSNDPCWCGSGRKYKRCHKELEGRIVPGTISPWRTVPPEIERPAYADTGVAIRRPEPHVKSPEIIERMRRTGRSAAEVLALTGAAVRPGITTDELDAICHAACIEQGGYPSPLNYNGFPQVAVHLGERGHLPRHPRRPPAGRRRHRQPRRHDLPRRRARRHERDVPGRRRRRGLEAPGAGHPRVPDARHRRGEAGAAALRHRSSDRAPRHQELPRRGAGLRRPRHRRAVPHRSADPALLRPRAWPRSWSRA